MSCKHTLVNFSLQPGAVAWVNAPCCLLTNRHQIHQMLKEAPSFHNFCFPLLRATCHSQLAACREAGPQVMVFVTQLWVCMSACLCVYEDWCSRDQTPTSCCVNSAPPVAQSGKARAIHTSSVSMSPQGLSKPSCVSHTPSYHICLWW